MPCHLKALTYVALKAPHEVGALLLGELPQAEARGRPLGGTTCLTLLV